MDRTTILQAIRRLSVEDRLELLFQQWDQLLDDGWKPMIDDDLEVELDRRWAKYRANPEACQPQRGDRK